MRFLVGMGAFLVPLLLMFAGLVMIGVVSKHDHARTISGLAFLFVGSIDLFDTGSYIAVRNAEARRALHQLRSRPIKGKRFSARILK